MARIEQAGDFPVTIGSLRWVEGDRKGVPVAILELPLTTDKGDTITYHGEFSSFLVPRKGRGEIPLAQINAELCVSLGMSEPFNPAKIGELEGKPASVTVVLEEWEDKTTKAKKHAYKAKYLNGQRRPSIEPDRAAALIAAALGGEAPPPVAPATPAPKFATPDDDAVPF